MGIDIYWEDERGERLADLPDPAHLVSHFLPPPTATEFQCLRFVDPAGDTTFNQAQIVELVHELERRLASSRRDPKVDQHLRTVVEFVRQALGRTHTYIKFVGD